MRFKPYIVFAVALVLLPFEGFSQDKPEDDTGLDNVIEAIAEQLDAELDYTDLVERLYELSAHPINLNDATEDDLQALLFLTEFQIFNLIKYRNNVGQIFSFYELQYIYGFDVELSRLIMPFVTLEAKSEKSEPWKNMFKYGRNDLFLRYERVIEEQKGYIPIADSILEENPNKSRFLGSPNKLYTRYKFSYKDKLSIGFTAEKDPGEQFFNGAQKYGFDFYTGHIQVRDIGRFKTINLGDYSVQFGQGLVAWSSMSFGKTPYVMDVARKARGITRYTSTNENQYFRGAATTVNFGDFEASAFFSYKSIDANVDKTDTLDQIQTVSSFQNVGYHRTPSEIENRNAIQEMIAGGNLRYSYKNIRLGSTFAWYNYNVDLVLADQLYRLFDFQGNQFYNTGLDFRWQVQKLALFGEMAINDAGYTALVAGATASIAPQMSMSLVYRDMSPGYYAGYASAFGESSSIGNEKGFFIGTDVSLFPGWKFRGYFDMFAFPWITYQANAPSDGFDWFAQVDYQLSRSVSMFWRLKGQEKDKAYTPENAYFGIMLPENSFKARYSIDIKVDKQWRLKSQVEYNGFTPQPDDPVEHGYLLSQDLIWDLPNQPLRFASRFAVFKTDTYNSRIYAYEYDVLYAFSIPAYYYQGKRMYLLMKYSPLEQLDIWFRIARTYYNNRDVVSSGLTEINAPHKTDVKLQIRYKF